MGRRLHAHTMNLLPMGIIEWMTRTIASRAPSPTGRRRRGDGEVRQAMSTQTQPAVEPQARDEPLPEAWASAISLLGEDMRTTRRAPSAPATPTRPTCASSPTGRTSRVSSRRRSAPRRCAATSHGCPSTAPRRAPRRASWPPCAPSSRASASTGMWRRTPPTSSPPRGARDHLPRVLTAREAARLLDGIPTSGPLELRDRAIFELAYSCGLRAEEIVSLRIGDVDHDARAAAGGGQGAKDSLRARRRARAGGSEAVPGSRPPRARGAARRLGCDAGAVSQQDRSPARHERRATQAAGVDRAHRRRPGSLAARAAPQLRDAPARRRRGPAPIQELLGHASVSSTQIYTRVESARLRSAYARSHPRA